MESDKIEFEVMDVIDMLKYAEKVSRQRLSQIILKYKAAGDTETASRFEAARQLLKSEKKLRKPKKVPTQDQINRRKAQSIWHGMLGRCGNSPLSNGQTSYIGCAIEFRDFEDFFAWAVQQVGFNIPGFELDKDILFKGNTVYSPDKCVFVPRQINGLFVRCVRGRARLYDDKPLPIGVSLQPNGGSKKFHAQLNVDSKRRCLGYFDTAEAAFLAYKHAKEQNIKTVAERFKDQIDPKAYHALINWQVEITD